MSSRTPGRRRRRLTQIPDCHVAGRAEQEDLVPVVGRLLALVVPVAGDLLVPLRGGVGGGAATGREERRTRRERQEQNFLHGRAFRMKYRVVSFSPGNP